MKSANTLFESQGNSMTKPKVVVPRYLGFLTFSHRATFVFVFLCVLLDTANTTESTSSKIKSP